MGDWCVEWDNEIVDEAGTFWPGLESKVAIIFEIDTFCSTFPGRNLVICSAMGRYPSVDAWKYMDRKGVISHRYHGNRCFRMSMLNSLRLFGSNGKDEQLISKEKVEI